MYCPKCMNNSLHINSRGVMHIVINGKQMDAGRFLYDTKDKNQFYQDLSNKFEEFFKWYANFQNVEPISKVQICTSDVSCDSKCRIPISHKANVILDSDIIPKTVMKKILDELGHKYNMTIELESN